MMIKRKNRLQRKTKNLKDFKRHYQDRALFDKIDSIKCSKTFAKIEVGFFLSCENTRHCSVSLSDGFLITKSE